MKIQHFVLNNWLLIAVGILMVIATLIKLLGFVDVDSDWYWFIAGLGFIVQGILMSAKHRRFNEGYKIVRRETKK